MTFDEAALAVLRNAWPAYTVGHTEHGDWVARFTADLLAPVLSADSPEGLTDLLSKDASHRRHGGGDSEG